MNGSKPITIIDYGNTTQTEQVQAIKNLFNHLDYLVGNTESIAEAMLEGANIGKQSKSEVVKRVIKKHCKTLSIILIQRLMLIILLKYSLQ